MFGAIRELMAPPESKKRKIGFRVKEQAARYGKARAVNFHVSGILETWKCHFDRVVNASASLNNPHFDVLRIIKT